MTTSSLYHTQGIVGFNDEKTMRTADTEIYPFAPMLRNSPARSAVHGKPPAPSKEEETDQRSVFISKEVTEYT